MGLMGPKNYEYYEDLKEFNFSIKNAYNPNLFLD